MDIDIRHDPLPVWLREPLPAGFKMCESCGFDHVLEEVAAKQWHDTADLNRLKSMEISMRAFTPVQRSILLEACAVKRWRNIVLTRHACELWSAIAWAQANDANSLHDMNRAIVGEWSNEVTRLVTALGHDITCAFFSEVRRDLGYVVESV